MPINYAFSVTFVFNTSSKFNIFTINIDHKSYTLKPTSSRSNNIHAYVDYRRISVFRGTDAMVAYCALLRPSVCQTENKAVSASIVSPQLSYANQSTVLRILCSTLLYYHYPIPYRLRLHAEIRYSYRRRRSNTSLLADTRFLAPFTFYTSIRYR